METTREVGIVALVRQLVDSFNHRYAARTPLTLILASITGTILMGKLYRQWCRPDLKATMQRKLLRLASLIPSIRRRVELETRKMRIGMAKAFHRYKGEVVHTSLPAEGRPAAQVVQECKDVVRELDKEWDKGIASGAIYHGGAELTEMLVEVNRLFCWSNPLHPEIFPGIKKLESEVIAMVLNLYNAPAGSGGCITSGGTESILMAMKAYRDWGRDRKGILEPNMVVPCTAHAAFSKGAQYFGIKLKEIPVDPITNRANPRAMARAIDSNTVAIMGSAPCYSVGCIDPITEIAALAKRKGVGMHVDACLGGFLLPFLEEAGFPTKPFDFRVDGVTSISCDTHKYGFSPKGTSCLMYRTTELRAYQYFTHPGWVGGIYASPTMSGSRSGAVVAGAWATLVHIGRNGYVEATRKIVGVAKRIGEEVTAIPGLKLMAPVEASVVSLTTDTDNGYKFDIYDVVDRMHEKGWFLNCLQYPSGAHIACTYLHTKEGVAEKFFVDLRASVAVTVAAPVVAMGGKTSRTYGMCAKVPQGLAAQITGAYFDVYYEVKPEEIANQPGSEDGYFGH
jgi:sphinganine-1-phosphate aldolase